LPGNFIVVFFKILYI